MSGTEQQQAVRRGFLKALGLGTAAAAAAAPALAQRSDQVRGRDARKESEPQRVATRYKADSPQVQAFYRTNGYE